MLQKGELYLLHGDKEYLPEERVSVSEAQALPVAWQQRVIRLELQPYGHYAIIVC